MLVQALKLMPTISFIRFEATMLDIVISLSTTSWHPCTKEFIVKKLIWRHYLLHQDIIVTLKCGLHIIFTFHMTNAIFSLQALSPTSFTTFLTHDWTSARTTVKNIGILAYKVEIYYLKSPHVMPGYDGLECTWNNMDGFVRFRCSLHIYHLQVVCSKTQSITVAQAWE